MKETEQLKKLMEAVDPSLDVDEVIWEWDYYDMYSEYGMDFVIDDLKQHSFSDQAVYKIVNRIKEMQYNRNS